MAGGTLKVGLMPPADMDSGAKYLNVTHRVTQTLHTRGLHVPDAPRDEQPEVPANLTSLDDAALGTLLNKLSQWCGYVEGQLAIAAGDLEQAKAELEFTQARIRMAIKENESGKKLTVQDKDDIMTTDERVLKAKSRVLYADAIATYTQAILNKAKRAFDTVSRRITQRGQEVERMKREHNVANVPAVGHTQFRTR